jgi:diguanylate cyclase (GGDEF)-like protein
MQAKGRKRAIKHERFLPALRILTTLVIIVVFYDRFRFDVFIAFAVYMLFAALKLFLSGLFKNPVMNHKYLDAALDMLFISCLTVLTGGSSSILWPLYLAPVISFTVAWGGRSGIVVAAAGTVFYLLAIYYEELSLKNVPADFLIAIVLVTSLTALLFYRDKKAVLKIAATDSLTRTYNLGYFQECLDRAVERYEISREPVSLLFIDVDDFKVVNDTYGHMRGDEVLKAISEAILLAVRKQDLVFRYGGDEFAVILQNASREDALQVAERVLSNVNRSVDGLTTFMKATVSVGIAVLDEEFTAKNKFLEAADKALYEAKRLGKNRAVIHSGTAMDRSKRR